MIKFKHKGNFRKTESYFDKIVEAAKLHKLDAYGQRGVDALNSVTPVDTGETASSWYYRIIRAGDRVSIVWGNSKVTSEGTPVVILLHYGHGTRNGGYVEGIDFINPAMRQVFDDIQAEIWKEVLNN